MLRATLKSLLSRKLRLVLSGLAVVLGVMFVAGTMTLTDTISRSFERVIATAYGGVDVVVSGADLSPPGATAAIRETATLPASLAEQLRDLPEVAEVVPEVWGDGARVIGDDGQVVSSFSAQVGGNWLGESEGLELRAGTGPSAPDEVAINAVLAQAGDIEVGDTIGVVTREPRRDFTVTGIFGYEAGRDSWFGETHVAFVDEVAQQLMLGERDVYTEISLIATTGVSPAELRDVITATVDGDHRVETGQEAGQTQSDLIRGEMSVVNAILLGFAVVALIVGVFLVFNTFSILVAQRLRELALLRAMGASRRQVVKSVLLEAAVIGIVAATIGLGLGVGVAALLSSMLASQLEVDVVMAVPVSAVVAAYAVGLVVTVLAALVPALRASRIAPVAAMQRSSAPERSLRRPTILGAVGLVVGGALVAVALSGPVTQSTVPLGLTGVVFAFLGVSALTPALARPVTSVIGWGFSRSVAGELGRRNTARHPRRTAITAAALMIGVALVTASSTFFGSFAESFGRSVEGRLDAELVISGDPTGLGPVGLDPAVLEAARDLDGVRGATAFWNDVVEIGPDAVPVQAVDDLPAWLEMTGVGLVDGAEGDLRAGQVALAERIATRQGLGVGDELSITLPRAGERRFEVAAVYEHNELFEVPLLSVEDASDLGVANPSEAFLALADGADAAAVRGHLVELVADTPGMQVHDRSSYVEQQTREFDQAVAFVQVLLLLAMVIAVLGVVNTLVLSVIERTQELGLLRAIGLGRAATARMVAVESVVISLFGALLGVVTGAGLGTAIVRMLRDEGFAYLALPWGLMASYLVAAAVVGVLAGVIPAIRAARMDVLGAIATE